MVTMGLCGLCRLYFVVALLITGVEAGIVLLRNGCREQGDLPMGDVVSNATLLNNQPWTCASYCKRQNVKATHLALQDEECLCVHTSSDFSKGFDRPPCTNTCPGHHGHVCGGTGLKYSIYRFDNLTSVSSMQCVAVECSAAGEAKKTGRTCSDSLHGYCINKITKNHQCDTVTTWSNYKCPSSEQIDYEFRSFQFCNNPRGNSLMCQSSALYWIGGTGPWAPPKPCQPVSALANGSWNNGSYMSVGDDMETITYTCDGGYTLNGIQRRECMADGSWTGKPPTCVPDPTQSTTDTPKRTTTHNTSDPTVSTTDTATTTSSPKGLSTGAIAGICVGSVVAAAGVGFAIFKFTGWRPHFNHLKAESNANTKFDPSKSNQTAPDMDRTPVDEI